MSIALDSVDLSAAVAGSTGYLDWTGKIQPGGSVGTRSGKAHLRVFNESGAGIKVTFSGGKSDRLPAGGWADFEINAENRMSYLVEYVLAGAPVSLLLGTLYEVGEPLPPIPALGNSPIGIGGGTVTTSQGSKLVNDGNAPGSQMIEATPNDQATSAISETNDGAGYRKILSANVLRTVLNIVRGDANATKAQVQIGDSGDTTITTFYGKIGAGSSVPAGTVAGDLTGATMPVANLDNGALPAGVTIPGGQVTGAVGTANAVASNGGSATVPQLQTAVAAAGLAARDQKASGSVELYPTMNDATLRGVALGYVDAGGVLHDAVSMRFPGHTYNYAGQWFSAQGNNYPQGAAVTGTGAGTYNHGVNGGNTPTFVCVTPNELNSTQTVGVDSMGSVNVHVSMPNAWPFYMVAGVT